MQAPTNSLPLQRADATRRRALGALGSLGVIALAGCGGGGDDTAGTASGTTTTTTTATTTATTATTSTATTTTTTAATTGSSASCAVVPEETAGPYPADGSQASNATYNVLALSGIVRSDIRTSIGGTVAVGGVPLTLKITLTNTAAACAPLSGYAIYLWHCTREGTYSVYTTQSIGENHLRGVQATDASGLATFTTVVPGCYAGRMPHMHLEIYRSVATATGAGNKLRTTQLAFPTDVLRSVYAAAPGYAQSTANLNAISFATDNVFSDGTSLEMTSLSGNVTDGYVATISISIAA